MKTIRERVKRITTAAASALIGASLLAGCGNTEPTTAQTPADTTGDTIVDATEAATIPYVTTNSFFTMNLNCVCALRCLNDTFVESV